MENKETKNKIEAVYMASAVCNGSGTDRYRWVSGISKKQRESIPEGMAVLVDSHTQYNGQMYKLAVYTSYGWQHRQIRDDDYTIIDVIR